MIVAEYVDFIAASSIFLIMPFLGAPCSFKFMVAAHYGYLVVKMLAPKAPSPSPMSAPKRWPQPTVKKLHDIMAYGSRAEPQVGGPTYEGPKVASTVLVYAQVLVYAPRGLMIPDSS